MTSISLAILAAINAQWVPSISFTRTNPTMAAAWANAAAEQDVIVWCDFYTFEFSRKNKPG
jgi:hypothetical protein